MRLDEIGENHEILKAKIISYTTNKAEQARGGQEETTVPMEPDDVSGSELHGEDWDNVDEVRRETRCYNCGMLGHVAKDCRMKGKGKGKGRDEGKGSAKGRGQTVKGAGKKGSGKSGGFKGEQKGWGYQGQCWTCGMTGHKSSECRWEVDNVDEDDAESRRSGERYESEKDDEVGGVWIVGNVEELEDEEMMFECRERRGVGKGTSRPGSRIECWAQISADQRDGFSKNEAVQRCGSGKILSNRWSGVGQIRADQGDGFCFFFEEKDTQMSRGGRDGECK